MQESHQSRNDNAEAEVAATARHETGFVDSRPEAAAQHELTELMNESPRVSQQRALSDSIQNSARMRSPRAETDARFDEAVKPQGGVQLPAEPSMAQLEEKTNNTGLPDHLKSGIESLSGMSMDHVKVHYNSHKPAQLQAHAYAQGSEIYLAGGQEKHLPHEAWHVVQQAQGRVAPTRQMKSQALPNEEVGLEAEADIMGNKATATERNLTRTVLKLPTFGPRSSLLDGMPIQRFSVEEVSGDLLALLPDLTTTSGQRPQFRGDDDAARSMMERNFTQMLEAAAKLPNVHEQAARVSSDIKASQYFSDSNTRMATAAVYMIYELSETSRLKAAPLETFASISEKEQDPSFNYIEWLINNEVNKEDAAATGVPTAHQLEEISGFAAMIGEANARLFSINQRYRAYAKHHKTLDDLEAQVREWNALDKRLAPPWEEYKADPNNADELDEVLTIDQQRSGFEKQELGQDEKIIWMNNDLIEAAKKHVHNGKFLGSITQTDHNKEMSAEVLITALSKLPLEIKPVWPEEDDE